MMPNAAMPFSVLIGMTDVTISVTTPIATINQPNSLRTIPLTAIPPPIGINEM